MVPDLKPEQILEDSYFFIPDAGASSYYRFVFPLRHFRKLGKRGNLAAMVKPEYLDQGRAFFLRLVPAPGLDQLCQSIKDQGKVAVLDVDSHIELPSYRGDSEVYRSARPSIETAISKASCVTASSQALAEELAKYSSNVLVVPDYVSRAVFKECEGLDRGGLKAQAQLPPDAVVIGWTGVHYRQHELLAIKTALEKVIASRDNVYLATWGFRPDSLQLPSERCVVKEFVAMPLSAPAFLSSLGLVDIGLVTTGATAEAARGATAGDHPFDRCRSGRQVIEYGLVGASVLAQDAAPYRTLKDQGAPLFLAGDPADWEEKLVELVEQAELRREQGLALTAWTEANHVLGDGSSAWDDVFQRISETPA